MRVLYPGAFDAFHRGHIAALDTAREVAGESGTLIVGVNSDAFLTHYKRTPSRPHGERIEDVAQVRLADEIVVWDGPDGQAEQILSHRPDVYIAGIDWLDKDLAHQLSLPALSWFGEHNISLLFLRRTPGVSTTALLGA